MLKTFFLKANLNSICSFCCGGTLMKIMASLKIENFFSAAETEVVNNKSKLRNLTKTQKDQLREDFENTGLHMKNWRHLIDEIFKTCKTEIKSKLPSRPNGLEAAAQAVDSYSCYAQENQTLRLDF